jgi:RNA polymerase sigma-70 factor (ECF subfamily)
MPESATAMSSSSAASDAGRKKDERSDEELLLAYKEGEVAAFRVLVKRHEKPVYRFCLRSLGNPEHAADAAQEVFLRVVKYAPKWERRAKFTTWMYTIARNFCIDEARKGRFRRTESLNETLGDEEGGTERIDTVSGDEPGGDDVTDARKLRATVDDALAELPEEQRTVFVLRHFQGLAFKEIAEATDTPENTVKSRMRYALAALRKVLLTAGFEPPDSS